MTGAGHGPAASGVAVEVQNPGRCRRAEVDGLAEWMPPLVASLVPGGGSLTLRLVADREMRRLNRTYRGHDESTDVLSFPGGEVLDDAVHLGDIAVAVPTARRQAATRGLSLSAELRTLALHGLLHCLGYDHETDDGAMERLERELRRTWIQDDE